MFGRDYGHRFLYEYRDADGRVLYRGKTTQTFEARDAQHRKDSPWYFLVDSKHPIDQGPISKWELGRREKEFIPSDGGTLYNSHHNGMRGVKNMPADSRWDALQPLDPLLSWLHALLLPLALFAAALFVAGCTVYVAL